jgi:hypothetical protein
MEKISRDSKNNSNLGFAIILRRTMGQDLKVYENSMNDLKRLTKLSYESTRNALNTASRHRIQVEIKTLRTDKKVMMRCEDV